MANVKYLIAVLLFASASSASDLGLTVRTVRIICSRGLPLSSRALELYCCQIQTHVFSAYWYYGGYYLSRHLELLKTWRCPQLVEECENQPYGYTEFTKLTYDRFCNRTNLEEKCISTLQEMVESNQSETETNTVFKRNGSTELLASGDEAETPVWNQLVNQMDVGSLPSEDLAKPCVQVAQMDSPDGGYGDYNEILAANIPFCSMAWCGYSRVAVERDRGIRIYDCLPAVCQANVIIMMVVVILLAIAVVVANLIVITVFATSNKLQNSQAMFKISLAAADLLVGVFVLPTFVVNLAKTTLQHVQMGEMYQLKMVNFSHPYVDWDQAPMQGREGYTVRKTTGFYSQVFDDTYTNAAGCVTSISLLVSIYMLMLAGFDRLFAVYRPLRYRRHPAKKIAIRLSVATWVVAIIFSLLPLMTTLRYGLVSTMLFAIFGPSAHIVYIVVFLIPLVMVWATNIFVYITVRKQARKRMEIATHSMNRASESETESRLTITLGIIVGVFTLSALPAVITSVVPLTVTHKLDPSNTTEFTPTGDVALNSADFVAALILMCNSLWNCFIYSARNRDFKKGIKELKHKIRRAFRNIRERRASERLRKSRGSRYPNSSTTTNSSKLQSSTTATLQQTRKTNVSVTPPGSQNVNGNSNRQVTREDSVFRSFKINVNTDGFFRSVMRRFRSDGKEEGGDVTSSQSTVFTVNQANVESGSQDRLGSINETIEEAEDADLGEVD